MMLALSRAGRQGDAFAAYRRAHRSFVEELGSEPGVALRELQRAILVQDAALDEAEHGPGWTLERGALRPSGVSSRPSWGTWKVTTTMAGKTREKKALPDGEFWKRFDETTRRLEEGIECHRRKAAEERAARGANAARRTLAAAPPSR